MLDKNKISEIVTNAIDNELFIVDIVIGKRNNITIYLDSYQGLSLDDCERIHRKIYPKIEEVEQDFELTVSSPGLTSEFKVWQQYYKNKGQEVEIATVDGRSLRGIIEEADEKQFVLRTKKDTFTFTYNQIKKTKLILKF